MNWTKVILAGVVGGVVRNIADFVMHGLIMGSTYAQYADVFDQEGANPVWFFVVALAVALAAAILFAKTRRCWGDGFAGEQLSVFGSDWWHSLPLSIILW